MARKLTFEKLPEATAKILEILTTEGSEHTALPELLQRMALLEKKIDHLQKTVSSDRPVMDMQTVCKILKLRPKAVSQLAISGVLLSHAEGRKAVFYEDDVVKFYMNQSAWKAAVEAAKSTLQEPETNGAAQVETSAEGRRRIDMKTASQLLGRSLGAVYQLTSNNKVPFHKEGAKVYFYTDELKEWVASHPPRPRRKK